VPGTAREDGHSGRVPGTDWSVEAVVVIVVAVIGVLVLESGDG
jgi:hypothetical protein